MMRRSWGGGGANFIYPEPLVCFTNRKSSPLLISLHPRGPQFFLTPMRRSHN
uniref:Uncharacterized protein n=1 Tax=Anguilla anguilla TaxID=7936 RepID=A0A0E9VGP1_ANGAN